MAAKPMVFALCGLLVLLISEGISGDSCVGQCNTGLHPDAPCQCNSACESHDDCCSDYQAVCLTCKGRCGHSADNSYACQCNKACSGYNDCCPDYDSLCRDDGDTTVTDGEIEAVSERLFATESTEGSVVVNFQGKTHEGSLSDKAPRPLIGNVSESMMQRETFSKLAKLFDNYIADVSQSEHRDVTEACEEGEFLDAIMKSAPMAIAGEFLAGKKYVSSAEDLRGKLAEMWFEMYDRDGTSATVLGSSGFEHVFIGEIKSGTVGGFHGWVHFGEEESRGNLDYLGHINKIEFSQNVRGVTDVFTWNNKRKPIGGMLIGTSPEVEMALYTICFMTRPNSQCRVSFNGMRFAVQTYAQNVAGKRHVGSAYPIF